MSDVEKKAADSSASDSSSTSPTEEVAAAEKKVINKPHSGSRSAFGRALQWLDPFHYMKVPPVPEKPGISTLKQANYFSRAYFTWMNGMMLTGYLRPIEEADIPTVDETMTANYLTNKFYEKFQAHVDKGHTKHIVLRALVETCPYECAVSMTCRVIVDIIWMTAPQLSRKIIYFVSDAYAGEENNMGPGAGMVVGLVALLHISSICQQTYFQNSGMAGSQFRSILINAVYRKSLVLSNKSRVNYTNGKITNIMSTDTYRVEFCCMFVEHILDAPVPLVLCLVLLLVNIGVSALCGFALLIIAIPMLGKFTSSIARFRIRSTIFTDSRIRIIQEILQNMRIIKFFAWENAYIKRIFDIRKKEIALIRIILIIRSAIFAISMMLPIFASMISFVILSVTGNTLSPAKVFASLSLFNILRIPLMVMPMGLTTGIDALIALTRIQKMLLAEELEANVGSDKLLEIDAAIVADGASFVWEQEGENEEEEDKKNSAKKEKKRFWSKSKKRNMTPEEAKEEEANELSKIMSIESTKIGGAGPDYADEKMALEEIVESESAEERSALDEKAKVEELEPKDATATFSGLHDLNFCIKKGELIVITGFIGSGKTSLLASLVGEMKQTGGKMNLVGRVAYCPQPWIQNSTLRDNILFGQPYDEEKYNRVIVNCALQSDLDILPAGDMTEIGERGINISGGQKSRVTLARAAYYGADIVIMDDVLSAVDANVGRHLVDDCICGILKGSTRLLATHQLHVLPHADRIIFMNGDGTLMIGTYDQLLVSCPKFAELITYGSNNKKEEEEEGEEEEEEKQEKKEDTVKAKADSPAAPKGPGGKLMTTEERQSNNVSLEVYLAYFRAGAPKYIGWTIAPMIIFISVLGSGVQVLTSLWLSFWTNDSFDLSKGAYIGIFVMLGVVAATCFFSLGFATTWVGSAASVKMNIVAVEKVLTAPMSFFDTSPLGRIINRFSNDVEAMDNSLVDAFRQFLISATGIISVLILIIAYFHWFALALAPMCLLYLLATAFYRASAVDIKRLDSVARSKVFSHFSETLTGLTSVRAYNEQGTFIRKMENALDQMNRFSFVLVSNQRWLSIRLESIALSLVLIAGMLAVSARVNINPSSIGLVVSYCLSLSMQMAMLIKQLADVENNMNAAERVYYYMKELPSEAAFEIEDTKPRDTWPEKGGIEIKDLYMRYRPGLPYVLQNLNLSIKGGEKIGICGRTGAGKSSIMAALYRLAELSSGSLSIDGVDISKIGLHQLRSKLAIIPQDPVLFRGTIRSNLDPFDTYTDAQLWDALRRSGLLGEGEDDAVKKFQLDETVEDDGANFSLGERQLLALARALVRNFQILVLDEATSSVDYQTDAKIQDIIVREFAHCTILCIAHRLKTIINYDKILVLDAGTVAEFDDPKTLFMKEDSIFRSLCLKANIEESEFITRP
ncbi:P-loop containing nucleoside triphosphate hydrolase protein [Limtongia smithiae]|uniref:P-loop containing nucleoside triphosphate hydrolase protein n=1 Tax=Limtongia smithiae TaxID=1125753 RepID=UPI0034CE5B21